MLPYLVLTILVRTGTGTPFKTATSTFVKVAQDDSLFAAVTDRDTTAFVPADSDDTNALGDISNGAFETTTNIAESSTAQTTTIATTPTVTTTTTTLCEVGCGSWTQVAGTCFQVFTDKLKWNAAQAACEDFGRISCSY